MLLVTSQGVIIHNITLNTSFHCNIIIPFWIFYQFTNNVFLLIVFCAIVSHPADTIVSYMNKAKGATVGSAAKDLGFKGMWGGLGPRIIMIGTLTALQWFIYDTVKVCD